MTRQAEFYQVMISSELRTQGLRLLEHLIAKRLIFGGPVFSGPARFLWRTRLSSTTTAGRLRSPGKTLRDELIKEAEKESAEAICMITFSPLDGSPAMQALLEEAFRGREQEQKPVPYKDAVAALTFVATSDIPKRRLSSWGDLSKVQPNDPTRQ